MCILMATGLGVFATRLDVHFMATGHGVLYLPLYLMCILFAAGLDVHLNGYMTWCML